LNQNPAAAIPVNLPDPGEMYTESGSPVLHFKGRLHQTPTWSASQSGRTPLIVFEFLDVEFIKTSVPFEADQFDFQVPCNPQYMSGPRWEAVIKSIRAITGVSIQLKTLVGKVLECEFAEAPGNVQNADGDWVPGVITAWQVVAIDGKRAAGKASTPTSGQTAPVQAAESETATGAVDIDTELINLAVGKDDPTFQQDALNHPPFRGTPTFNEVMTNGAGVLTRFITDGRLTKGDNGLYVKP
jgi:hypothetical protein